jgi:alpha-L-arabinofuranosidase
MGDARVTVRTDAPIDRIDPALYGHFSEHLGRCIYDGLYHDETADGEGYREDVLGLLEDLEVPVLRWPGGCFADDYHWEDGVGDDRLRRRNLFWAQGREEVYGVRYWGLGNENWGCGGRMSPEGYAREYRRFANYVGTTSNHLLDHDLELIACGFSDHEWNRRFLEEVSKSPWGPSFPLDHLTLHHYYGRTVSVVEDGEEAYDRMLVEALELDEHIKRIAAAIDAVATTRDIGVIIDEWGIWHTEASPRTPSNSPAPPSTACRRASPSISSTSTPT